ncbi:MAG: TonB-dependent receptor [Kiritimatiellae bacterium]|nr:TonB-dependent receptor [Kiritimatiellia bacterium]MDW8459155.1 TonB-dependent receptor [Verrucomicrobiota bacterium]
MKQLIQRRMILAAIVSLPLGASAETVELPEIVVTPLRTPVPAAEAPASVYTITSDDLSDLAPRTTPEALRRVPSVMVQKTAYGQGSPYLRGFTGFRTLGLIDGIRLNNSVFREGPNQYWATIDPFSVDRYEVVLGPASVLYGSDAIGGAMNAIPPDVPDWDGRADWEHTVKYRGATADQSHQARFQTGARLTESFGLRAGYSWKTFDDLRGGREVGKQPETGYNEMAWDARASYFWQNGASLTLGHQHLTQDDAWRTHRTIYGIEWEGTVKGDDLRHVFDQDRTLTYLRLAHSERDGAVDAYTLTLSRHKQGEDLDRLRGNGRREFQGFDVETWGAALTLESESAIGRWVYGADVYRDLVNSYSIRIDPGAAPVRGKQGPVADNATYDLLGAFVQNTLNGTAGIEITPGVRYTHAHLDAEKVDKRPDGISGNWDAVVGSLRALIPFSEDRSHNVYAGISQGFRAPNLSDLTRLDSARSKEIETPVDDLKPERFITADAGWRRATDRWKAGIAYFHTWIEDLIVRTPTGEIVDGLMEVTKKNSSEGYVHGIELLGETLLGEDWRIRGMATWMEGEADGYPTSEPVIVREPLSRVMPLTGRLALRWQPVGQSFWAEAEVEAAEKADRLSSGDKRDTQRIPPDGTPGYVVGHLRGGYSFASGLSVTLALENVSDEDYRIHGSGLNEPGRQLVLAAQYTF